MTDSFHILNFIIWGKIDISKLCVYIFIIYVKSKEKKREFYLYYDKIIQIYKKM